MPVSNCITDILIKYLICTAFRFRTGRIARSCLIAGNCLVAGRHLISRNPTGVLVAIALKSRIGTGVTLKIQSGAVATAGQKVLARYNVLHDIFIILACLSATQRLTRTTVQIRRSFPRLSDERIDWRHLCERFGE
jgi:hypothetical protein